MSAIDLRSVLLFNNKYEIKCPKKNDTKFNKNFPNISLINNLFKDAFSPYSFTTLILKIFLPKVCPFSKNGKSVKYAQINKDEIKIAL